MKVVSYLFFVQKGSSGSLKLCSRLLERYHQVNYLLINDIANIDQDEPIGKRNFQKEKHDYPCLDLKQHEYRYECIQNAIEQRRSRANGFLIVGELDEQKFLHQWQRKVNRMIFHFPNLINFLIAWSNRFDLYLNLQYTSKNYKSKFSYNSSRITTILLIENRFYVMFRSI